VMEVATVSGHKCLQHLKRYTHIKPESLVARMGWVCGKGIHPYVPFTLRIQMAGDVEWWLL